MCRQRRYTEFAADLFMFQQRNLTNRTGTDVADAIALLRIFDRGEDEREEWFENFWKQTRQHTRKWWPSIQRVAAVLQERRTLNRDGIYGVYDMIDAGKEKPAKRSKGKRVR